MTMDFHDVRWNILDIASHAPAADMLEWAHVVNSDSAKTRLQQLSKKYSFFDIQCRFYGFLCKDIKKDLQQAEQNWTNGQKCHYCNAYYLFSTNVGSTNEFTENIDDIFYIPATGRPRTSHRLASELFGAERALCNEIAPDQHPEIKGKYSSDLT